MSEPSTCPASTPAPVTAWMAVAGAGVILRKATLDALLLPRIAAAVANPLAGRDVLCQPR